MSSPAEPSTTEALSAAADELRRRRADPPAQTPQPKPKKTGKARKAKTARYNLRLPDSEYRELVKLRKRLDRKGVGTKKGDLVRAGLMLLILLDRNDRSAAIRDVIAPEPGTTAVP